MLQALALWLYDKDPIEALRFEARFATCVSASLRGNACSKSASAACFWRILTASR